MLERTEPYVRDDVKALLALMAQQEGPQMHEVDAPTGRLMMGAMAAMMERPAPAILRKEDFAVTGPAGPIPCRIYRNSVPSGPDRVLTYFHGGGWVIGDIASHDSLCAEIALQTGWTVVSVDYRLAPEAPFPAATEDCIAVVRHLAGSPAIVGHAVTGQILAGDSAGGNLAAAVSRELARDVTIEAQWLIYPGTDMKAEGGSMDLFAEGYVLTKAGMIWFMEHYAPDPDHPWASPLHATEWDGLPPALVFTCSLDPLRDQGRAYAARLVETGHRVIFREAVGQVHACMQLRGAIPSGQDDLLAQLSDLKALIA
jgi:acetyl esterase